VCVCVCVCVLQVVFPAEFADIKSFRLEKYVDASATLKNE